LTVRSIFFPPTIQPSPLHPYITVTAYHISLLPLPTPTMASLQQTTTSTPLLVFPTKPVTQIRHTPAMSINTESSPPPLVIGKIGPYTVFMTPPSTPKPFSSEPVTATTLHSPNINNGKNHAKILPFPPKIHNPLPSSKTLLVFSEKTKPWLRFM
ncbi:hypothetical protein RYX36_015304, partial [Vicia faba]